jgi:hypothetical protein
VRNPTDCDGPAVQVVSTSWWRDGAPMVVWSRRDGEVIAKNHPPRWVYKGLSIALRRGD